MHRVRARPVAVHEVSCVTAIRSLLLGAFWIALLPAGASAQQGLRGTVFDAVTGAPIEYVDVLDLRSRGATTTDGFGEYVLMVPVGPVDLRVGLTGYLRQSRSLTVPPGQMLSVDFVLETIGPEVERPFFPLPPADTVSWVMLDLPFPDSAIVRSRQVGYRAVLPGPGQAILLDLFPDTEILVQRAEVIHGPEGYVRTVGTVVDRGRRADASVVFIERNGRLTADVRVDGRTYFILPSGSGDVHLVLEIDPGRLAPGLEPLPALPPARDSVLPGESIWESLLPIGTPEGEELRLRRPLPDFPTDTVIVPLFPPWIEAIEIGRAVDWGRSNDCFDGRNLGAGTYPEIRVLVLYTDAVAQATGDLQASIRLMVFRLNQALMESGIRQKAALAHTHQLSTADNNSVGVSVHLVNLTDPAYPHFDEIRELRNTHHADVVALLVQNTGGGKGHIMEEVSLDFENSAFAVLNYGAGLGDRLFEHELGHVMGAQHHRADGGSLPLEPYHYNHGYRLTSLNAHTVMANAAQYGDERLPRYSNPDQAYQSEPLGIASTDLEAADNRRALINTAAVTAAFRTTPVWFVSATGTAPWAEKRVADERMSELRFGDFDGDGEDDAFRIDGEQGYWWWSRSASEPWKLLNDAPGIVGIPLHELAFGDFNNNDTTDVFRSNVATATWQWSPGGRTDWSRLNGPSPLLAIPTSQLGFANFIGDETTDVFRTGVSSGTWHVSEGGSDSWTMLNGPGAEFAIPISSLAFGDFDGNGVDDVLTLRSGKWHWSNGGSTDWSPRTYHSTPLHELAFGDFDGNGTTDAFRASGNFWYVSPDAQGAWLLRRRSCHQLPRLRFGDFDGDGTTDVLRAGIRP